jgi:hypothetical protein
VQLGIDVEGACLRSGIKDLYPVSG